MNPSTSTLLVFLFTFIVLPFLFGNAMPNLEWDLTICTAKNVKAFHNFVDYLKKIYDDRFAGLPMISPMAYDIHVTKFHCKFIIYATELAAKNVFSDEEFDNEKFEENLFFKRWNEKEFLKVIGEEFDKNIFNPENPIQRGVMGQIYMLTVSFGIRIYVTQLLKVRFSEDWRRLHTLLAAYKHLSAKFCNTNETNENGILTNYINEYASPKNYIENFKFVLKLSEFPPLTSYEVHTILSTVMAEFGTTVGPPHISIGLDQMPEVYHFVRKHLIALIGNHLSSFNFRWGQPQQLLERIGVDELSKHDDIRPLIICFCCQLYGLNFRNDQHKIIKPNNDVEQFFDKNCENNELYEKQKRYFGENMAHYAHAIRIENDHLLLQIIDALHNIVHINASSSSQLLIDFNAFKHLNEINWLIDILRRLEDTENIEKINELIKTFEQKETKNKFLELLKQIKEKNAPSFGQILSKTFHEASAEVKFDEKAQKLSIPKALVDHFMVQMFILMESMSEAAFCQIGEKFDFASTLQNILSQKTAKSHNPNETMQNVNLPNKMSIRTNSQLFKLLCSLAIRLSVQFENDDDEQQHQQLMMERGKYIRKFIKAYKCVDQSTPAFLNNTNNCVFQTQITLADNVIEVIMPNWKTKNDAHHLNDMEQAKKNFDFLLWLSNYSLRTYQIVQMARQIIGQLEGNAQIWVDPAEFEIFLKILKRLIGPPTAPKNGKIEIQSEFCLLTYFVEVLWGEMLKNDEIPIDESIEAISAGIDFVKERHCMGKAKNEEISKYFGGNMFHYANTIKIQLLSRKDVMQIIDVLIDCLRRAVENDAWNYAIIKTEKEIEWNLVRIGLDKLDMGDKWAQIDKVRGEWKEMFDKNWAFHGQQNGGAKVEEFVTKLIEILGTTQKYIGKKRNEFDGIGGK